MTWTKLGDEFSVEAAPLSDAAYRTHTEALMWSNFRLLDLAIPKKDLKRFAETDGDVDEAVAELIHTGWWQDCGDSWFIGCRFPEWQRDRVQVEHRRQKNAENQRRKRRHELDDHSLCLDTCKKRASADDSAGDSPDDPGRVGTGRVGAGNPANDVGKRAQDFDQKDRREPDWPVSAIPGQAAPAESARSYALLERVAAEQRAKEQQRLAMKESP